MRNIAKLVSLALLVAVTPPLSACNKAEPTPPKSYTSPTSGAPNEAWSRLLRMLWPRLYAQAEPVAKPRTATGDDATDDSAKPGELKGPKKAHNPTDAWNARDVEPKHSVQHRRPRAGQHPASARHRRDAESHKAGQHPKACECRVGRRGRTAVIDEQQSRPGAAQVAQIADRGVPTGNPKQLTGARESASASARRAAAQIPEGGGAHPSAESIAWRPSQNPNELIASSQSI